MGVIFPRCRNVRRLGLGNICVAVSMRQGRKGSWLPVHQSNPTGNFFVSRAWNLQTLNDLWPILLAT